MPASKRNRTPAAQRKQSERELELQQEHEAIRLRLERLQVDHQQLDQQTKHNEAAQHQMVGRLRYIEEKLGLVPPMAEPEPFAPPVPEGPELEEDSQEV